MDITDLLKKIGFQEKETLIYTALLKEKTPPTVRQLSSVVNINRGTVHDALKMLMKKGLVSYYHEKTKQKFIAEDPKRLLNIVEKEQERLLDAHQECADILPEVRSQFFFGKKKHPITRFYEGHSGIRFILEDVLDVMEQETKKEYYVFSSLDVRKYLYRSFKNFTSLRISKKIKVKVISIGLGAEDEISPNMLAERRWLTKKEGSPTFTIIYGGRTAHIALGEEHLLHGTVIEDNALYETGKLIFNHLWKRL